MLNFTYFNPVNIVFGKGQITSLANLISADDMILMTYGGGSIKKNGLYERVKKALKKHNMLEFGGIEPNPKFETLMKAVDIARTEKITFLLSVGGGSVLDGTKFIAAAIHFAKGNEWDILSKQAPIEKTVPIGSVITLPATGSEMNCGAVISRNSSAEKLVFMNPQVYPKFSILDPETTFSLPKKQTANGIVDAFVHVTEQYLTYPVNAPLQDRQAEAILLTLIEEGPKVLDNPEDYDVRANLMWCATQALNGNIACGVPQDWATHMIGHEVTALYGLYHAQTLAVILPAMMQHQRNRKSEKLVQYAECVWGITENDQNRKINSAIEKTIGFFNSLGVPTSFKDYGIGMDGLNSIGSRIESRGMLLGEHHDIGKKEITEILELCV
ncbi:MAG: iron-containing alcohol dehydrogenase [Candidatus Latescibacteria bacterium]|nr:iron-containing alcohol dehydrogenase [Candidatus Latescibacterota bacterium]